ncbi:MAG: ABC transporter ATP-binding protein/permease [Lachnospiraceae bacterium]|nr:ABC transporter ATP-binding protein/permease [Lachnospiraceae bacterium]
MLELKNIKKDYPAGDGVVHALKGISLKFRKSEFVSILGQSGCGKTTMLNIIGGLDHYSDGDLIINGKSTKDFKDRDWDTYRNHSIGFVFQSYNLIPHQTVLQNVELSLTLSGVSKAERRERAIKALEDVGLKSQLSKKPSEMSGGQMQRVAIARALVNNPDIILADEPTGALDTETSVQVMEILKNISKDRLIIMVTHNPELAEQYSSRIIRMLDGEIKDDSNPLSDEEIQKENSEDNEALKNPKKLKKTSMSFATSFSLSLKNLFTKKGRTILTSFAGSIGIIGIALVLSISQGLTKYIDDVQEEALSSYPLTIEEKHTDLSMIMETFMGIDQKDSSHEDDAVYKRSAIYEMMNALNNIESTENDLKSFKKYIEEEKNNENGKTELYSALSGVKYSYPLELLVYTKSVDGDIIRSDTQKLLREMLSDYMGMDVSVMFDSSQSMFGIDTSSMMMGSNINLWEEMLSGDNGETVSDVLKKQYDLVYGEWPNDYDEVVLVLDKNNELDDMTLYALGLEPKEDVEKIMNAAFNGIESDVEIDDSKWSYEEICNTKYKVILNSNCYSFDETTGLYTDLRDTDAGLQYLYDNGIDIKVTGIIRPDKDANATMLTGSIGYTYKLTRYVIEQSKESSAIEAQLNSPTIDVFTGLPFNEATGTLSLEEKGKEFIQYIEELDDAAKAKAYIAMMSIPSEEQLNEMISQTMASMDRAAMEQTLIQAMTQQMGMNEESIRAYLENMSDDDMISTFTQMITEQIKTQYAANVANEMSGLDVSQLVSALSAAMDSFSTEQFAKFYDEVIEFSETSYDDNLVALGYIDLDTPSKINLYASTFENKDKIEDAIKIYNKDKDELSQIAYTDYVGLMMSSVTTIINAITYVLIAFIAISLVVSSIMIGVITLISVQERTKEIGILRAIGASKRDVSSMFNAETIIIGFTAGLIGVVFTYLMCIPINMIIHRLTGLNNLNAFLPVTAAIILILISVGLTLISGIIPSRSAAKKDPVVALRTE